MGVPNSRKYAGVAQVTMVIEPSRLAISDSSAL
jgi:hypothetical protein